MTRRGYTTDPCHSCGTTLEHERGKLCPVCAKKIVQYDAIQKEAQLRGTEGARPIYMKERAYAIPHTRDVSTELGNELEQAFWELSYILSLPTNQTIPYEPDCSDEERQKRHLFPVGQWRAHDWDIVRLMDPGTARAYRRVFVLMQQAVAQAHAKGVSEGRNLLLSLAAGQITNDEFNERAARLQKED